MNKGFNALYGFRPYYYGPYIREVYSDITWLEMNKLVEIKGIIDESGSSSKFKLTKRGFDYTCLLLQNEDLSRIHNIISEPLKEMSVNKLVEYAHELHPEYDINQIKEKKPVQKQTLDRFVR